MKPALEAFGLLILENYFNLAIKEAKNEMSDNNIGKWTQSGNAKRNGGYTSAGLERYKKIYDGVKKSRKRRE